MFPLPYLSLFSSTLILSTLMAISASQWLFVWMALELNLLSFIPLLTATKQFQETEASIKYFLAQALGSGLILLALSLSLTPYSPFLSSSAAFTIMVFGILMKMGVPPCHFWFPSVMSALPWLLCLILATWQKLIPMTILFFSLHSLILPQFLLLIAALSGLVGGLGGINQTQLRPLLAYSSIAHMGWIMALVPLSAGNASLYLAVYIFISSSIIFLLNAKILHSVKSTSSLMLFNSGPALMIMLVLLSLGGLPPLLGFFPKWMALATLTFHSQILLASALILGSLLSLYYYLTLAFSMALSLNPFMSMPSLINSKTPIALPLLSLSFFPLAPALWSFL